MPHSIAQVVVGLPVHGPFDYTIPPNLREQVRVGHRVNVPFRSQYCLGYVVGLGTKSSFPRLKPIHSILENAPFLNATILKFAKEFSQYYACSWGEAIDIVLPSALRTKRQVSWEPPVEKASASGKTIVLYQGLIGPAAPMLLEKMRQTLSAGQGVILLVPEARKTASMKEFLEKELGVSAAVFDSSLTPVQELKQWLMVKEGGGRLVIGTRWSVFAPVVNLGLIVMVDEENHSYKQEPSPFYHSRDVMFLRQKYEGCELAFVTPTPTAELWKILKTHKADIVVSPPGSQGNLQIVDLANYKPQGNMLISFPLQNFIRETMEKNGRVLLFLNRRGFSMMTRCNQCGFVIKCDRCQTNLSFLYSKKKMVCHRCGKTSDLPKICPKCRSSYLRSTGTGIEKLESEIIRIYPQARVALFDRETKGMSADANIVIATQAIIPVLKSSAFSLAAVLDFDGEINRVDFRASERVFSLLTRLCAGTKEKVVVQTRNPGHYAIKAVRKNNAESFYREELKLRRDLGLPPFIHLIAISMRGTKEAAVFDHCKALYEQLNKISTKNFEVLDPEPDITPKLRDKFRFTIMLKGKAVKSVLKIVEPVIREFKKSKGVILTVNVDP